MARVLIWTFTMMNVWTGGPAVSAARPAPAAGAEQTLPPSFATIYGPQRFTRTSGAPNVFTATVTVPAGTASPFMLHLQNGDASGGHRVSSATIEMNGVPVAGPSDFSESIAGFDRAVALGVSNTLRVTLRSAPAAYVTISVTAQTVDRTPPQLAVVGPAANALVSTSTPQIVVSYADPAGSGGASGVDTATLVVRIDGVDRTGLFTRGASEAAAQLTAAEALADGTHTVAATIADLAGNSTSTSSSFIVDSTAPAIETIEPGAGQFVGTATPTIRIQYQDADGVALSTLRVLVGGEDRTSLFSKDATDAVATLDAASALPEGPVEVVATIRDPAGNTGTTTSSFVVDTMTPSIEIVQPGLDHYTSASTIEVGGTVTDASPATVTVNGVAATVVGSTFTAVGVPVGAGPDVTLQVTATDAAGNLGTSNRIVHVDRVNPTVQLTAPVAGAFLGGASISVAGTVSDTSPVTVTVNGVPAVVANGSFTSIVSAPNGPLSLQVLAEDAAGNTATAEVAVTIDSIAPALTIASPAPEFLTNQSTVHVTGTVADATPVALTVNGAAVAVVNGAFSADTTVTAGPVSIGITAIDAAGNATSTVITGTVDQSQPVLQITTPANGSYVSTSSAMVRVAYQDNGAIDPASLRIAVDGQDQTPQFSAGASEATATLSGLGDGPHQLTATVRDAAGNETTTTSSFVIDTAPPVLTVSTPAAGVVTSQASVRVQGTVADSSPTTLTIGGVTVAVTSGAFAYDAPLGSDGAATIAIVATDAAGNAASTSVSVTVDRAAPVIQIASPAPGSVVRGPSLTVTGTVSDASNASVSVNGVAASMSGAAFTVAVPVTDGGVSLEAIATDAAGNTSTASSAVTVDSVPPVITVLQPGDGQYTNASEIDVSVGVSDATAVTVTVNGVAATASGPTFTATVPVAGGATSAVTITATDAAGNSSQRVLSLNVDRVAPVIAITSPVQGAYRKGPILDVTGTVSDASAVSVEVGGQPATVSGGAFSAQVPASDGPFTIQAVARDAAGNTAAAQRDVVVDSVAPAISVSAPANGSITNQSMAHVTGAVADASPFTLRINGSIVALTDGGFVADVAIGGEGDRTLTLRATDAAGNESTLDLHLTLDQTPPDLQITSPAAGAILGGVPVAVQGLVYDATTTTVTVNGAAASRVQDAWQANVDGLGEGAQLFTVTAVDAAGNTRTLTRAATIDVSAPVITIASPSPDALTNGGSIQVAGTAADATLASVVVNGVTASLSGGAPGASRSFVADLTLAEGDNHLIAVATDALGRSSQAEVVVTRDSTPPNVSMTSPDTLSALHGGTATIAASDNVGLASVSATLNGISIGSSATAPFAVALTLAPGVAPGTTLSLVATATDRAGNTATATRTLQVVADGGVAAGQVLSDVTGLPLAGATVTTLSGTDGSSGAGGTAMTDERGGYSLPADNGSVLVSIVRDGMTTVERHVPIQTGIGTSVVDARLTPLAQPTVIDAAGGTVTSGNLSLAVAGAASIALTPLSPQGLPALLPLGWSPIAAFDVHGDGTLSGNVALTNLGMPQGSGPAIATVVAYRPTTHGWFVVAPQVSVSSGSASFAISGAGAYALVVPDESDASGAPIPVPAVNEPLTGVSLAVLPATATATGTIAPSTLPPAGGTATGALALQSPTALPSGTVIQAQVTETYALASGATASEEQRSEDIVLYRLPAAVSPEPSAPSPALSAFFPITPTRSYETSTLTTGTVHLDIFAGREAVRGQTGGSEPVSIDAGGGVTLSVPAHALPADTAVRVQSAILSGFLPGAAPNTAPAGVVPVGEVVIDFASQQLQMSAELSVSVSAVSGFGPAGTYLLGRVVRIDGIPRVLIVARAEVAGDRLVSRTLVGLPGLTVGGRYVFYRIDGDAGFVAGVLSASGAPVAGLIESNSLPFVGMAGGDGRFVIATRAGDVQLTGRVAGTSLQGTATVTVPVGAITARDVVLAGAVTTAVVTPADGATLVSVSAQIEIVASAPLDATAAGTASITLTDVGTGAAATLRRVVSGSGRVLAIVPAAALTAAATYRLEVSGLADAYGGAVAVAPVTFTTRADTAAVFDPEQVTVSFPDDNGIVHVTAPPGAVPALTSVLVINAGNGIVAQFQAGNDGSMNSQLTASIRDRLIVTITDPQGRSFSFERNTYVAADGTTGVGSGGGKVKSATTEAELQIPEGAIDDSAVFKLDGFDLSTFFPDDPSIADLLGASIGSSIKIEAPADLSLNQQAHLAFPKPENAPDDAFYFVYRRLQGPDGKIAYETIDEASTDPATGKVVTHSPPFSGFVNSIVGYGDGGVDPTGGTSYTTLMYTLANAALPGKALMGVITGKVLRPVLDPGAATPRYEGVANALVSGVDAGGQPLTASTTGANVAISQKDGTFTLFDKAYEGGTVTLSATTPDGETKTATAYESNPQDLKSPGLGKYRNIATANITFPAKAPDAPPAAIAIQVYKTVNGALQKASVVVAGTPVAFGFKAENASVTGATVQGATLAVRADTTKATTEPQMADGFTPAAPGSYTVTATASPASGPPILASATFRVIASGGSAATNLPNDPPAVVTGLTVPSANATGVQPSVFPQVTFTEPVKHLPQHVVLQGSGGAVAVVLSGDGPDGPVETLTTDDQVVTSLTIQPIHPLLYNTTYTLTLTSGIVDLDVDINGQPTPKSLVPYTTTFTTFGPEQIGQSAESFSSPAIVVLGDRGYLAVPLTNQSGLKIYDVSDPTALTEVLPSTPIAAIGYPYDLVGEDASPLTGGRVVAMTTGPIGVPYRPSNVFLYDVATDQPQWIGAVTLGNSPSDGITRRTVMKDGVLYAATAGIGKGIQIVDLNLAVSNYQAATANGTSSPEYYGMLAQLGLEGQGFGQDAIGNTIFVDTGSGDNSRLWDLAVGDLAVDGSPTRIVAATGAHALVLVDPVMGGPPLYNGPLVFDDNAPALIWGYGIALSRVGTRDIAVIVGFLSGPSNPLLVTVDVTDPRHPHVLGSLALTVSQFDPRNRLLANDNEVFVAGPDGTTIVNIGEPVRPVVTGTILNMTGSLASDDSGFLFGIPSPFVSGNRGIHVAELKDVRVATFGAEARNLDPNGFAGALGTIAAAAFSGDPLGGPEYVPIHGPVVVYGGSTADLSDRLRLHVNVFSKVPVTSFTWAITGPGGGEYATSDSADWEGTIKPIPGVLDFAVTVQFSDGEVRHTHTTVEVGIRSDDVMVIGWIDKDRVPLSADGVSSKVTALYPIGGLSSISTAARLVSDLYAWALSKGHALTSLTETDREYILNWMFKYAANDCPHCPPSSFDSEADVIDFEFSHNTSYKLLNRFQVKYRVKNGALAAPPKVLGSEAAIGWTFNPFLAGVIDPGQAGPNNAKTALSGSTVAWINDGSPVQMAVDAFNTLMAPLRWNNIGSRIEFSPESITRAKVFMQVYPTYFIYYNRRHGAASTDTQFQAARPIENFNLNPYPPGPAPFIKP